MMKELFDSLGEGEEKPGLFCRSKDVIWTDPYIAGQLLACHLSQETEAASRNGGFISRSVDFLMGQGYIHPGDRLLDLGCGPGLYGEELSKRGVSVTGMDFSKSSLDYAEKSAKAKGLDIKYVYANILDLAYVESFDVILQIYGEMNVFSPEELGAILEKIHRALKPGGKLIFDVTTPLHRRKNRAENRWYIERNGFWGAGDNLVLEQGFDYPEHRAWLDRYFVINDSGVREYRNWFRDYNREEILDKVTTARFECLGAYGDLTGKAPSEGDEWIALALKKS